MPTVKKNSSGKTFTIDQARADQIKANPSLSQNYTFLKDQPAASTPPEVKGEAKQQQSPISAPPQEQEAPAKKASAKK